MRLPQLYTTKKSREAYRSIDRLVIALHLLTILVSCVAQGESPGTWTHARVWDVGADIWETSGYMSGMVRCSIPW